MRGKSFLFLCGNAGQNHCPETYFYLRSQDWADWPERRKREGIQMLPRADQNIADFVLRHSF
jgi:hypothetical protein